MAARKTTADRLRRELDRLLSSNAGLEQRKAHSLKKISEMFDDKISVNNAMMTALREALAKLDGQAKE